MNGLITRRLFPSEPRSVLHGFGSAHRDIDSLFEDFFGRNPVEATADWAPRLETFVTDEALHIRTDLPGVEPKAVEITIEDDVLTIRGERKAERESAAYREINYGRFERRIRVPQGTEADKITASYANGVLDVTVPIPKPVSRKVTVNVTAPTA
jgi:HSP20 family protein